jgi:DNA-binding transcriptional MerR regulator
MDRPIQLWSSKMQSTGDGLTIGRASRLTGLSLRAIRYYEIQGLVSPPRDRAGQRRYGREIQARLEVIAQLRRGGLGIAEVRQVLDEPSRSEQAHAAIARLEDRASQLAEALRRTERVIELIAAHGLTRDGALGPTSPRAASMPASASAPAGGGYNDLFRK